MDKNISQIIQDACKKEGINYTSCNPNYHIFCNDAKRLGEIYLEINSLIDELDFIFNRHKIENKIRFKLEEDLKNLYSIEHDLLKLANKIKKEND